MYGRPDYEMNNVDLWVSEDGSYGSGDIAFFSTEEWTGREFNELDEAPESEKLETAMRIHKRLSRRASRRIMSEAEKIEVRVFIIDSDGVEEIK
jgi:hypothetical protein